MTRVVPTVRYREGRLELIDQTLLPAEYRIIKLKRVDDVCEAIASLRVRGAPALGIAGAYGMLVSVEERWGGRGYIFDSGVEREASTVNVKPLAGVTVEAMRRHLDSAGSKIAKTRPTAVNLGWAIDRLTQVGERDYENVEQLAMALIREADAIYDEDLAMCTALGRHGAGLLADGDSVITHCNTGGLAASGFGTALGVVFAAVEAGKAIHVFADETRPLLQGGRLTAWECRQRDIPVTVLVDGAAASLLARGGIACAIVGADRIAANGDTANKVGTLGLALTAKRFDVPFYVAAPSSTIDVKLAGGDRIPIEQRAADEVRKIGGVAVTPVDVDVYNPAFDVTPAELIAGIITENGVIRPPYNFI